MTDKEKRQEQEIESYRMWLESATEIILADPKKLHPVIRERIRKVEADEQDA